jgi:hypothetical protein
VSFNTTNVISGSKSSHKTSMWMRRKFGGKERVKKSFVLYGPFGNMHSWSTLSGWKQISKFKWLAPPTTLKPLNWLHKSFGYGKKFVWCGRLFSSFSSTLKLCCTMNPFGRLSNCSSIYLVKCCVVKSKGESLASGPYCRHYLLGYLGRTK